MGLVAIEMSRIEEVGQGRHEIRYKLDLIYVILFCSFFTPLFFVVNTNNISLRSHSIINGFARYDWREQGPISFAICDAYRNWAADFKRLCHFLPSWLVGSLVTIFSCSGFCCCCCRVERAHHAGWTTQEIKGLADDSMSLMPTQQLELFVTVYEGVVCIVIGRKNGDA